jgi:hypothetical protein
MIVTFYDLEDDANPLNGSVIRNRDQLRQILRSLQEREPFSCELTAPNGAELVLGVGAIGFADYCRNGDPPYLCAVTNRNVVYGIEPEFLVGGTPTPVAARFCMPFDDVIKIAVYFFDTGTTCPLFSWEEI